MSEVFFSILFQTLTFVMIQDYLNQFCIVLIPRIEPEVVDESLW
jgi:hypothetical protein